MSDYYVGKNDLLFKKVFADQRYAHILIGFIQDIFEIEVESVQIETPYRIDTFYELQKEKKLTFTAVDVVARLTDKSLVTIEMQVNPQKFYAERSVYYVSEKYVSNYGQPKYYRGSEGQHSEKYSSLYPVFGLNILDFVLFKDSKSESPLRHFDVYDVANKEHFPTKNILKFSFLELPRTPKKNQKHLAYWMDYFTKGHVPETAPDYIQEACDVIAYQNLEEGERKMVNAIEKAREDQKATILYYKDEGRAEGLEQGKEEIAKNMLKKGLDHQLIIEITGLDQTILHKLAAEMNK